VGSVFADPQDELARLIPRIQALARERDALRRRAPADPELDAKQRALDVLRWRLATVARRAAEELYAAAPSGGRPARR
jgi:hypothetical protein